MDIWTSSRPSREQSCLSGCSPGVTQRLDSFTVSQHSSLREPTPRPAAAHTRVDICSKKTLRRACSPALRPAPQPSHMLNKGCVALHLTRHTAQAEPPDTNPAQSLKHWCEREQMYQQQTLSQAGGPQVFLLREPKTDPIKLFLGRALKVSLEDVCQVPQAVSELRDPAPRLWKSLHPCHL